MLPLYAEMSSVRPPKVFWPLLGLGIMLASQVAIEVFVLCTAHSTTILNEAMGIIIDPLALLAGLPTWWFFVVRPRRATILRGILAGALSAFFVHIIFSMIMVTSIIFQSGPVTLETLLEFPLLVYAYTAISLIVVGWVTIPIGAIGGGLLVYLQCVLTYYLRKQDRPPRNDTSEYASKR